MKRDVVLIHGMWCRGEHLDAVATPLREAGFRVHQPTLPFHDQSDREDMREALGRASLLDYADYCQGVIHQLKFADFEATAVNGCKLTNGTLTVFRRGSVKQHAGQTVAVDFDPVALH